MRAASGEIPSARAAVAVALPGFAGAADLTVPWPIMFLIFAFMPADARARAAVVCKEWPIGALWIAYRTDPIAQGCRNAIVARLLGGGILYTKRDYSALPDDAFNSHVNQAFVSFAKAVVDAIYCQGFAAYVVDTERKIPRCIPFTRADIRVRVDPVTFETQLGFFRDGEDEPDPNVYFIVESFPDEYGSLTSAMTTYYEHRVFRDMLLRCTAEAESIRCRPPIFTTTESDRAFEERRLAHIGEVDGLRASITRDNALIRNRIISDTHAQQERLTEMLNQARVDTSDPSYRSDPLTGLRNFDADLAQKYNPIIPLPADAKVASVPMATARADFVAVCDHINHLASICFGVNLEAVGGSTQGKSADTLSQANNVTGATVMKFRNMLTDSLINIYALCWGEEGAVDTEEVTIMFPGTVSIASMLVLFQSRLVTFQAMQQYLHKFMGLPLEAFEKKDMRPNPLATAPAAGPGGAAGGAAKPPQQTPMTPDLIKLLNQ